MTPIGSLFSPLTLAALRLSLLACLLSLLTFIKPSLLPPTLPRERMAYLTLLGEFVVLSSHFQDILERRVSPPIQTLVFIPKADQGDYADNYRPFGLPNTSDRIIDRAAYTRFCSCLTGALHPAQALRSGGQLARKI